MLRLASSICLSVAILCAAAAGASAGWAVAPSRKLGHLAHRTSYGGAAGRYGTEDQELALVQVRAQAVRHEVEDHSSEQRWEEMANTSSVHYVNPKLKERLFQLHSDRASTSTTDCSASPLFPHRDARSMALTGYPEAREMWRALPSIPVTSQSPKIALLMMIYKRIAFPRAWQSALETVPPEKYRFIIHSVLDSPELDEFFAPFLILFRFPSAHCNTVWLLLNLMSIALGDPDVSHLVTLSGDTLPLQNMNTILGSLGTDASLTSSNFCVDPDWVRAETWFMLRRADASFIVQNSEQFHALLSTRLTYCVDEDSFYWSLMERDVTITDRCLMMTDWSNTAKYWSKIASECDCPTFLSSSRQEAATCGRPSMFLSVTAAGMAELRSSNAKYWFVRKFTGDGTDGIPTYQDPLNGTIPLDDAMANLLTR
mmetsp:Transcript_60586/g.131322  ORF Transcript_60586/g.131322 Transcript_60586/m.131322 type:complete len:428 (-) Transcript_60586:242-1525(-)|eukprot:CAMPEP_0170603290 /NCGR_PEP_ID=MMETSP0224-20130122/18835_1 /TAXON_ID=285029 /ORGANISM="Togula jolla, Strain CCCM 725" /LENGTH=427 /DNA_ID=CAMNT_0010928165 /DNA_START=66 /DNA_END=1349 /DNA_ORIENTATION=-